MNPPSVVTRRRSDADVAALGEGAGEPGSAVGAGVPPPGVAEAVAPPEQAARRKTSGSQSRSVSRARMQNPTERRTYVRRETTLRGAWFPRAPYRCRVATPIAIQGALITEREHRVPLDHGKPAGQSITVFTRELAAPDGLQRPYLVFLQGGPGFEAARPTSPPSGWMKRALRDYRILLLDQRGTGRSSGLPRVVPRRLDRPRLRADPQGAGRRAVERPRPELRRVHLAHLPVDRAGRASGGLQHRRDDAHRATRRRRLRGDLPAAARKERGLLHPVSRGSRPRRPDPSPPRRRGHPPAIGRSTDLAPVPPARAVPGRRAWLRAPASRHRAAVRLERLPARRRAGRPLPPQPDLRDPPRVVLCRRLRDPLVRRPAPA